MEKIELLNLITTAPEDEHGRVSLILHELLTDQQNNIRTVYAPKTHLIDLFIDYFDDNLYGHFKDGVMTTIISVEVVE
jgi:hypothetical protein